jgi:hypothetical protein
MGGGGSERPLRFLKLPNQRPFHFLINGRQINGCFEPKPPVADSFPKTAEPTAVFFSKTAQPTAQY